MSLFLLLTFVFPITSSVADNRTEDATDTSVGPSSFIVISSSLDILSEAGS